MFGSPEHTRSRSMGLLWLLNSVATRNPEIQVPEAAYLDLPMYFLFEFAILVGLRYLIFGTEPKKEESLVGFAMVFWLRFGTNSRRNYIGRFRQASGSLSTTSKVLRCRQIVHSFRNQAAPPCGTCSDRISVLIVGCWNPSIFWKGASTSQQNTNKSKNAATPFFQEPRKLRPLLQHSFGFTKSGCMMLFCSHHLKLEYGYIVNAMIFGLW